MLFKLALVIVLFMTVEVASLGTDGKSCGTSCSDTPPNSNHSCFEQRDWGKCNETWMSGYCCMSCENADKCGGNSTNEISAAAPLDTDGKSCGSSCSDTPPNSNHSCFEQVKWNKCNESWMSGYCCRSCENADKCGGESIEFTVFDDIHQEGNNKAFTLYDDESCNNLYGFYNIVSSVNTNGHCIEFFEDAFCQGKSVIVKPGCSETSCCNPQTFVKCKFDNLASSYRACKNADIHIFLWIFVICLLLVIGFLLLDVVIPWLHDGLRIIMPKARREEESLVLQACEKPENKKIVISQLKFVGIIGKGNSADVRHALFYPYLNTNSDFMDVAVKTVKLNVSFSAIQKEIEIMQGCNHENILKFIGWLQEGSLTHIVTEFMHGGSLHSFLQNEKNLPTVGQLFSYIMQILDGMIYLGKAHILHRDLAARNCLLNSTYETLKISDFGLSRKTDLNYEYVLQNNLELPFRWLPVEAFQGKKSFSIKGDIWAFGIVIWEIFERGKIPYKGMNADSVAKYLEFGNRLSQPFYCSNEIYRIMLSCWNTAPAMRPEFEVLKIHFTSILNRNQLDVLPDYEHLNYYEVPVKIVKN